MTGSPAIDVVIGLVFIYLLYSLLASIIMEAVSTWFGFRARNLQHGISRLLNDDDQKKSCIRAYFEGYFRFIWPRKAKGLTRSFYNHPSIKYLAENKHHSKPSYISSRAFSEVIIDLLRGDDFKPGESSKETIESKLFGQSDYSEIDAETLTQFRFLWANAKSDVVRFQELLEEWFNRAQDRITGWYKRYTQVFLFLLGLFIASFFNVNTLTIIDELNRNPEQTAALVAQAQDLMLSRFTATEDSTSNNEKIEDESVLDIIGITREELRRELQTTENILGQGWNWDKKRSCTELLTVILCGFWKGLVGFVLTAIAVSLGAPFWFDLLNKLMKLRASKQEVTANTTSNTNKPEVVPAHKRVG